MVILNNQLREELWNARFREMLSRKECVRRFVTLKLACQSEVYMTLRQFQMSTTSQYTGRRERRLAIDKNKDKFVRMPKNDLLEKLFKLFEQQANWRFDDLRKNTQQPAEHLKEALSEIAVYLTKGSKELRNTWQLNSSFGGGEAAESEGGPGSGAAPVAEDDI